MKLGDGLRMSLGESALRRVLTRLDWPLLILVGALAAVGLANLYSATHATAHTDKFESQLVRMAIGVGLFTVFTAIDYRKLHRLVWVGFAAAVAGILAVFAFGHTSGGATRWLDIAGLRVQPSEFAKVAVIVALAKTIHDHRTGEVPAGASLALAFVALAPLFLIAAQPDLGSGIVVGLVAASIGVASLPKLWPLVVAGGFGLALTPLLWESMRDYQKQRWLTFLDPSADPSGAGLQTLQSIVAVGSGRMTGKGYLNATQNQFNFLPEYWTDFPFSIWAEEWGFAGAALLVVGFTALVLYILYLAVRARDDFGSMICVGVAAMLFWQLVINIAMVLGSAPVVGVPLPLISYGGSSLLTTLIALGLVSSVAMRRHHGG